MTAPSSVIHVLHVEDTPGDALLASEALEDAKLAHFVVTWAKDATTADALLASGATVDVVVLDLHLPECGGLETVERYRDTAAALPIVVATGADDVDLAFAALAAGMQDYVHKTDIDDGVLARAVLYAIERHRVLQDVAAQLEADGPAGDDTREALRELLAMVAHDLRSPLTAIVGLSALLTSDRFAIDDAARHRHAVTIHEQAERLDRLLTDLVDLGRHDRTGGREVTPVPVHARIAALVRHLPVTVAVDGDRDAMADVDGGDLDRIVTNLLENAGKYGAPPIRVRVGRTTRGVEIHVEDAGPGVRPDFVPRLFEMYARDRTRRDGPRGSGVGLASVQDLVQANDGDVRYEPNQPTGARFVVRLPEAPRSEP